MPDKAIEAERRRRASMGLNRGNLGDVLQTVSCGGEQTISGFQTCALREVSDQLQLRLVVEWQQFHGHVFRVDQQS